MILLNIEMSIAYLGREYEYFDAFELINESNHYSEVFKPFIEDVVTNINAYIDKEVDTCWYYNMRDYNVNKNGIGIKLKIIIEDLSYRKNHGYIDPERFPEITIHLNKALLSNIQKFKAVLLHELTHVIKVYIKNRNGLTTVKETLLNELDLYKTELDIHYKDKEKTKKLDDFLYSVFYIILNNEQLATINETCQYLNDCKQKEIHEYLKQCINTAVHNTDLTILVNGNFATRQAQVYNVLVYLQEHHFLNIMRNILQKYEKWIPQLKMLIAYYLNKHGYIRKPKLLHINFDIVYLAVHIKSYDKIPKNIENDLDHVYDCIYNNFEAYKKKLYNAVYAIMEKKDMFLPIDEVYNIIPYRFKSLLEQNIIEY